MIEAHQRRIVGHYDAESRDYIFCVDGDPPSLEAGVDVGAFAHLMRSAIDNLLWQLILARGGKPRTTFGPKRSGLRPTQFPIYEQEADFLAKAKGETRGVLPEDLAVIERAQPYKAGALAKWHPLAMLGHLNNVDKHRFVHPSFAGAVIHRVIGATDGRPVGRPFLAVADGVDRINDGREGTVAHLTGSAHPWCPDGSVAWQAFSWTINDDDPTEVARVTSLDIRPGREPYMEMKPDPTFDVSFSDRERPMTIHDLDEIRAEVHRVVESIGLLAFPHERPR